MRHMDLAFDFFSYLVVWLGFSGSTESFGLTAGGADNIGSVPIQGRY
jgi:hypothetical protein